MRRTRTYIAGFLLALFMAGGLLAPSVHRVHHQADIAQIHAQHAHALETVGPSVFDGTIFPDVHDLTCWLCNTHLVYEPHVQPATPTPVLHETPLGRGVFGDLSSASRYRSFIRGPPLG